jgi:hypothetical protein
MNKRRLLIGSVVVILLAGAAWAFGFFDRTDPAIAQLQQIGEQMWDRNLSDAQRDQLRGQFRQSLDSMSESQRRAFFDSNRERWSGRMNQRMDEYFTLPKAEQQKRLDEILNRIVQSRNSRQQQSGNANGSVNGGRRGDNNRGDRGRNMTDAQREERSKRRLDRSSPKQRAQFAEFRKQLDQRAAQRGIKLDDQGGRGGFGGGPRG